MCIYTKMVIVTWYKQQSLAGDFTFPLIHQLVLVMGYTSRLVLLSTMDTGYYWDQTVHSRACTFWGCYYREKSQTFIIVILYLNIHLLTIVLKYTILIKFQLFVFYWLLSLYYNKITVQPIPAITCQLILVHRAFCSIVLIVLLFYC